MLFLKHGNCHYHTIIWQTDLDLIRFSSYGNHHNHTIIWPNHHRRLYAVIRQFYLHVRPEI